MRRRSQRFCCRACSRVSGGKPRCVARTHAHTAHRVKAYDRFHMRMLTDARRSRERATPG
eukprot:509029-Pleurochrysis_carterae.AAC.4